MHLYRVAPLLIALLLTVAPCEAAEPAESLAGRSVEDTLRFAFAHSPALKAAQSGRQVAVAAEDRARAGFYPTLSLSGGAGLRQSNTSSTKDYGQEHDFLPNMDVNLRLSQPLWTGGALTARVAMQQAGVRSSDSGLLDSANSLAFESVAVHTNVLRYLALLKVTDDQIAEHQKILGTVRMRFNEGAATSGEVTQIESRLARVRAQRSSVLAGLDSARAEYLRVTGQEAAGPFASVPEPMRVYASAIETIRSGMDRNPRMLAAQALIEIRQSEQKIASSAFSPTITAEFGPTYERQFGSKSEPERSSVEAGVRMRWELYSGGADQAAERGAAAAANQARHERARYAEQLQQDVSATWSTTRSAVERVKEYEASMRFSRNTRQNFYEQFLAGQRGLLDLLDADSEYFTSAAERINANHDALLGRYRLLALGGDLFDALGLNPANWKK